MTARITSLVRLTPISLTASGAASKGLAKDRAAANVRILPTLGGLELAKLTTKRIEDWHAALATAPKARAFLPLREGP